MTFEQQQMAMIEKAAKRIWDMAKVDPELAARIPDPDVLKAFHEPGASYQRLAAAFYARHGFTASPLGDLVMLLPIETVRSLLDDETVG